MALLRVSRLRVSAHPQVLNEQKNLKPWMEVFFFFFFLNAKICILDRKSSRRIAEESTGRGNVCACVCAGYTCAGVRVRAYAQKCAG